MGLVGPLLASKVAVVIAPTPGGSTAATLRLEALHRRPGFEKCPIHREVLMRQKTLHLRIGQQRSQKLLSDLGGQQSVAVLRENRVVPHRIIDPKSDEPPEQQVKLHPLHQLTFRTNRIKKLQQARTDQSLRRDRGTSLP